MTPAQLPKRREEATPGENQESYAGEQPRVQPGEQPREQSDNIMIVIRGLSAATKLEIGKGIGRTPMN